MRRVRAVRVLADGADHVAPADDLPFLHVDARQVRVLRPHAPLVVAVEHDVLDHDDEAPRFGNRRATTTLPVATAITGWPMSVSPPPRPFQSSPVWIPSGYSSPRCVATYQPS